VSWQVIRGTGVYFLDTRKLFAFFFGFSALITVLLANNASAAAPSKELHIAVASNFASTLKLLVQSFNKTHPLQVIISSASTGKLTTQIRYGAPYDLFLAADKAHPQILINEQLADENSFFVYAQGQVALISKEHHGDSAVATLNSDKIKQLAVANPKTAPYGLIAKQWLDANGFSKTSFQYITGENINQTWQFFQKGGVDAALVALSQIVQSPKTEQPYFLLPKDYNRHLTQAAVILSSATEPEVAKLFLTYLKTAEASEIILRAGYLPHK